MLALWFLLAMPAIDGMALTPHYENPAEGLTFDTMVDEIADIGATHISVVVQWSQANVTSSLVAPHATETQDDAIIRRIIRRARGRGLKVMLFPILWVEKRALGSWRGTLKPKNIERWWQSYNMFILHYANMAREERVDLLSVGSELASMESQTKQWRDLIAKVRGKFTGTLLYSANWDHYANIGFWSDLDLIGLTGYYRLTENESGEVSLEVLTKAWTRIRQVLLDWQSSVGKPLLFTEVGYASIEGVAYSPWDYTGNRAVDLKAQEQCLEAFSQVWIDEPQLAGVFFWNWWGPGGKTDRWYTLKGKPGADVVRRWYAHHRAKSKYAKPKTPPNTAGIGPRD